MDKRKIEIVMLHESPENFNRHPEAQIAALRSSLRTFGSYRPVVVWRDPEDREYYILAGHGVVEAAKAEGWSEIWVEERSDLTRTEARALLIEDNMIARKAELDNEALSQLVSSVYADSPDLAQMAVGDFDDMSALLDISQEEPQPVEPKEPDAQEYEVERGDIWVLGEHRLLCAPWTDTESHRVLLAEEKADLTFAEPPDEFPISSWLDHALLGESVILFVRPQDIAVVYPILKDYHIAMTVWVSESTAVGIVGSKVDGSEDWHTMRDGSLMFFSWKGRKKWLEKYGRVDIWHGDCLRRAVLGSSEKGGIVFQPFVKNGDLLKVCEEYKRRLYGIAEPEVIKRLLATWPDPHRYGD